MREGFHTASAVVQELRARNADDAPILKDRSPPHSPIAEFVISLIEPFTRALDETTAGSDVGVGIER